MLHPKNSKEAAKSSNVNFLLVIAKELKMVYNV